MMRTKQRSMWAVVAGLLVAAGSARAADGEFARTTIDLGCVVTDVAKSVKFYTEAVGFTEVPGFKVPADYAEKVGLTAGKGLDIHVLVLGTGESATKLKLMQVEGATPKKSDNATIESQTGFRYLTIFVSDTNAALERLKKASVTPIAGGTQELPKPLPEGVYLTIVRDPDGNFVELVGPKK